MSVCLIAPLRTEMKINCFPRKDIACPKSRAAVLICTGIRLVVLFCVYVLVCIRLCWYWLYDKLLYYVCFATYAPGHYTIWISPCWQYCQLQFSYISTSKQLLGTLDSRILLLAFVRTFYYNGFIYEKQ